MDWLPIFVETQAIKYAAMASRFDSSTLAACHARYLTDVGESKVSEDDARGILEDHIGGDFDPELLRRPRIILMAEGFSTQVSASAVWLTEMGIDVSLIEFAAWQTGKEIVLTVSQTWPIPDAEEFVVTPEPPGVFGRGRVAVERRLQPKKLLTAACLTMVCN